LEKATLQQIKEQNRNLVFKIIRERLNTSRAEVARISHLTRTTVSDIVSGLICEGLVSEVGTGLSIGGKSPILLSLNADARHLIGLDLAYTRFSGAIVNLRGQIREMVSRPLYSYDSDNGLQVAYEIIDHLMQVSNRPLVGIGIGTPGLVSTKDGIVINAVNMEWRNFPLGKLLQDRYQLPVYVLNDCQASAIGEYTYGDNYPAVRNMIVIRVGHGIGAGIIMDGQIFQGDGGYAGEIGHVVRVQENGLPCRCGNAGCLETVASSGAVLQRARQLVRCGHTLWGSEPGEVTFETLEKAFQAGDPLLRPIILEAAHYMGMAIANLVGALNINKVILTGSMTGFGKPWLDVILETANRNMLPRLTQEISIEVGRLKDNEAILGATALLANNYSFLFK
jgi:predicted NBD/HSP70 family sugar kinase